MNATDRFRTIMSVVIGLGGLIWLALAMFNTRDGGAFPWAGLAGFLIVLFALNVGRTRRRS